MLRKTEIWLRYSCSENAINKVSIPCVANNAFHASRVLRRYRFGIFLAYMGWQLGVALKVTVRNLAHRFARATRSQGLTRR